jgi:type VI secretion system secreted protein Hcp
MPGNAFIKFAGVVKGESMQDGHGGDKGWIEIGDWNWDIEAETSFMKGGGASVGKPTPGTLSFSHFWDLSSSVLLTKIVSGTHFDTVTIHMLKQTGDTTGKPATYFELVAKDAFVTKVSTKAGDDGSLNQDVDMVFKQVVCGYKAQKNTGELEGSIPFNWNIAQMNQDTDVKGTI